MLSKPKFRIITHMAILAAASSGCCGHSPRPATASHPVIYPTTTGASAEQSVADSARYKDAATDISFAQPAAWNVAPAADFAWRAVPAQPLVADLEMSLEIPTLPAHIPGLIPIGLVRGGYVDDIRKAHAGVKVDDLPPPAVGASARLVRSAWTSDAAARVELALLLVHGDHVLILRCRCPATAENAARSSFDAVIGSIQWGR